MRPGWPRPGHPPLMTPRVGACTRPTATNCSGSLPCPCRAWEHEAGRSEPACPAESGRYRRAPPEREKCPPPSATPPARNQTKQTHSPTRTPVDPPEANPSSQSTLSTSRVAPKGELDVGTQLSLETVRSQYRHMRFRRPGSPCEGRQRRVIPRSQPPSSAFARAARAASPISAIRIEGRDFHSTPAAFGRCESSPAPACTPVSGITDRGMCSRRRFHSGLPCAAIQRASSSRASPGGMTRCQIVSVWPATSTAFARVLTRQLVCCPPFFRSGSLASVL